VARFTGKLFVLHAGRENSGNAAALELAGEPVTATSEQQARECSYWFRDSIWWEYDVVDGRIVGGIPRWDIWVPQGRNLLRTK
jgi:hypothetical protein